MLSPKIECSVLMRQHSGDVPGGTSGHFRAAPQAVLRGPSWSADLGLALQPAEGRSWLEASAASHPVLAPGLCACGGGPKGNARCAGCISRTFPGTLSGFGYRSHWLPSPASLITPGPSVRTFIRGEAGPGSSPGSWIRFTWNGGSLHFRSRLFHVEQGAGNRWNGKWRKWLACFSNLGSLVSSGLVL